MMAGFDPKPKFQTATKSGKFAFKSGTASGGIVGDVEQRETETAYSAGQEQVGAKFFVRLGGLRPECRASLIRPTFLCFA